VKVKSIQAGAGTVGVAAQVLIPANTYRNPAFYVEVKADADNSGDVFVGESAVSATQGYRLDAGESVQIPIEDPSTLSVIGSAADQSYTWLLV